MNVRNLVPLSLTIAIAASLAACGKNETAPAAGAGDRRCRPPGLRVRIRGTRLGLPTLTVTARVTGTVRLGLGACQCSQDKRHPSPTLPR